MLGGKYSSSVVGMWTVAMQCDKGACMLLGAIADLCRVNLLQRPDSILASYCCSRPFDLFILMGNDRLEFIEFSFSTHRISSTLD